MKSEEKAEMFYSMLDNNYASVQDLQEILIGFAKYNVEKVFELQKTKYLVGETGYLCNVDKELLLNNIQ